MENDISLFFLFSIVSEAGASVYSVSPEANKEMPGLDPNLRSAGKKLWVITKACDFGLVFVASKIFKYPRNFRRYIAVMLERKCLIGIILGIMEKK